ncbi:Hypothetical predicted protein, partial [Pelobates cultripes]
MQEMSELYGTISNLELLHKRTQQTTTHEKLIDARRKLRDLITRRHHRSLQYSKSFFYTHANKGGKYLARLLKGDTPQTRVHKLRLAGGKTSQFPEDIASEFQRYYQQLYNLATQTEQESGISKAELTRTFLQDN